MIQAYALTRRYGGFTAVDHLSFDVPTGEVVGFLGPNGAGKTTTIRMLTGSLQPTNGRAEVCGFDVARAPREVRRRIGYLPESTPLYPEMRVNEYLAFRAKLSGVARSTRKTAIDYVIDRCRLGDMRRRLVGHLSKGYRQRVGLAAAMVHDPPVLVLDDPTAGLDPAQIQEVRALIRELAGKHTVILSTHILSEVEAVCDRVVIIARGRLRAQGRLDELRSSALHGAQYLVETDTARAGEFIGGISGVAELRQTPLDDPWTRLMIVADTSRDLREEIAAALAGRGMIRELHRQVETLEKLFLRLVSETEVGS
jgi:ABC-2 type transport system ATP-binding protein